MPHSRIFLIQRKKVGRFFAGSLSTLMLDVCQVSLKMKIKNKFTMGLFPWGGKCCLVAHVGHTELRLNLAAKFSNELLCVGGCVMSRASVFDGK